MSRVHVLSWQAGYKGLVPADFLASLSVERRLELWSQELVSPRLAGSLVQVLEADDGAVVGFANVGPCRDDDRLAPDHWELYAIYLLPGYWGSGHGANLLHAALDTVPTGTIDLSLWVLALNQRARRFYERHGFAADGAQQDHMIGAASMRTVRYLLRLRA